MSKLIDDEAVRLGRIMWPLVDDWEWNGARTGDYGTRVQDDDWAGLQELAGTLLTERGITDNPNTKESDADALHRIAKECVAAKTERDTLRDALETLAGSYDWHSLYKARLALAAAGCGK